MNKSNIIIRPAVASDAKGLTSCMIAAYSEFTERLEGKRLPSMDCDYRQEIADYPVWIIEHDGRMAGGLVMLFNADHSMIANIAVHPDFQGQGLGGQLMRHAEKQTQAHSLSEMRLATHVLLHENIALYCHLGWDEYQRDDNRVCFKKSLR